jgi:hypothetical protein
MVGIKTVEALIKTKRLTPEELERHRDLIEECLQREKQLEECSARTHDHLSHLSGAMRLLVERTSALEKTIRRATEETENLFLRLMPREEFHQE